MISLEGSTYHSRQGVMLLTNLGLPELIAYYLADYEAIALALATHPERCAALRAKLQIVRDHGVLFDTPLFVHDLEVRLQQLVAALPPASNPSSGV